ncbi:hypothetical protein [Nostoc sp. C117]|uniref:hypothetical protein n=1 Tax=Nostoc sp. C117 TaxID=3349875 RepID=UPI00370DA923
MTTVTLSPQLSARGALYHANLATSDLKQRIKFRGILDTKYDRRIEYSNKDRGGDTILFDSNRINQMNILIGWLPSTEP